MFNKFSRFLNRMLDRFTFRQRFLLFSLIFVSCVPFPFYWFITDQNLYIKNAETQIQNFQKQLLWNNLLNNALQYQLAFLPEKNRENLNEYKNMILSDLNALKNKEIDGSTNLYFSDQTLNNLWESTSKKLKLNFDTNSEILNEFIDSINKKFKQESLQYELTTLNLYSENELITTMIYLLRQIQILTIKNIIIISNLQLPSVGNDSFSKRELFANQNLLLSYIEKIQELIKNNYTVHNILTNSNFFNSTLDLPSFEEYLNKVKLWAQQIKLSTSHKFEFYSNLKEYFNQNKMFLQALIFYGIEKNEEAKNFHQLVMLACIALTIFSSSIVLIFVIFHGLTSHFLELNEHIIAFSKGKFKKCFCSNAKDEFGPVGIAFDKMAQVVQDVVNELQRLGRQLNESVKQISHTSTEQSIAFQNNEKKIKNIEEYTSNISVRTHSLATTMNELTFNSEQNQVSEEAKKTLEKMGNKILSLKLRSSNILNHLDYLKQIFEKNKKNFSFLSKISNQASLLSLNSAIEASNILDNRQSFNKITQEIKRFSEKTAKSSQNIQEILKVLFIRIDLIHKNTNLFFEELNESTEKLKSVEMHLNSMAIKIENQTNKFQIVNTIMQEQAKTVDKIGKSLDFLVQIANKNSNGTEHLGKSMIDLNIISNKLQHVLNLFFHPKQIDKLARMRNEKAP